jgi:opine dehydrogenase
MAMTVATERGVRSIAVLGGGHGALAAAGDLALRGYDVRLALRNRPRFAELFATGRVTLSGAIEGTGELREVTDDHAAAVRGAQLVVLPLPATAQEDVARRIAGALEPGQVLLLAKGTLGAYVVGRLLEDAGVEGVAVGEVPILPYGARVDGEASVRLAIEATDLPTGVYPASATDVAMEAIRAAYPVTHPVEDALDAALVNIDPALHAPLVLMNAGSIEGLETFDVHADGATEAVVRVSCRLDDERIAVREALGYTGKHWPLRDYYERRDCFYGAKAFVQTRAQSVWREKIGFGHRYVEEDIGCGLALVASLGDVVGVATPLTDAFLAIAGAINDVDYRATGRTVENLGLGGLSPEELRARVRGPA